MNVNMAARDWNNERLRELTQKTMALVNQKEIVLPSTYRVVFSTLSRKYNVDIGAESIHTNEEIDDRVYHHVMELDTHVNGAIDAIREKDESRLEQLLEDTKRLKAEVMKLTQIAYEDALTHALNRKWLEKYYFDESGETFQKDGVIALIDLNDFKAVNDRYGHAVGDKVLVHLATRLKQIDAHVIRYGGDEFLLVFDSNAISEVRDVVNIMRELHLKRKIRTVGEEFNVSFAYGIAPFHKDQRFDQVIEQADRELYEDKVTIKERIG